MLQPSNGKTPLIFFYGFSIFSSSFLIYLYFLSYNFLYHKIYLSIFFYKNKTLVHLPQPTI